MALINRFFYGILILQIYAHAAPGKFEDIAKVEELVEKPDTLTQNTQASTGLSESARQKRYFNPYGYGFPPISQLIYPNFKRDDDFPVPSFGTDEPLLQIHKRVQEIANVVSAPHFPTNSYLPTHNPHVPPVPIFYPIIFVPPLDCPCNQPNPQGNGPVQPPSNERTPNVTNRFPDMEDVRQNWGFVLNDTGMNQAQPGSDNARPISFDPIRINRPNTRPTPPVEHGTVQSDATGSSIPQPGESNPVPPAPESFAPASSPAFTTVSPEPQSFSTFRPTLNNPINAPYDGAPTRCDGAILTCCHQPQVVYDCFAIQGCPNFTSFGNPCNTNTVLSVIAKFQKFYGTRSG